MIGEGGEKLPKLEKIQKVEEIFKKISQANSVIFTDFKGLNVSDLSELRSKLREVNAEYRVVKNTLALRAFQRIFPDESIKRFFEGPTAFTYCYGDPFGILKVLVNFSKDHENLKLKGGIIEGEIYDSKEIVEIANLPPKDVLLSKLLGSLNSPLTRLVYSLKWPINQLVWTLNAVKEEKEKNLEQ